MLGVGEGQWVNGGIEKGQWRRWSGSMGALVRVNGGIEKGQWALVRVNAGIEQWRLHGGIEKGQWGRWSGSMDGMEKGQVRQGLGFGSGRGVAVGQTGVWLWVRQEVVLQGCKLYLAGL